ncbi:rhodanese domain-containing protein [Exophiala viscosa]|uniref:Rhodanese domain-containing protein n=1 Tax=Exophiala viscosa TaxID=2486360 RepID=A0AAN6IEM5_9EURO|nr:rhodanese domain-containing protein [Exophiala viscosa]KAI1621287.1 rhodanese domain-containing protein [Exophiala viscosa]
MTTPEPPPGSQSIEQILASARSELKRLTPKEAYEKLTGNRDPPAILVDIRPAAQRAAKGEIEGSLIIERNVLEWRFDPQSKTRLPIADRYDHNIIVLCQEGYTSSLAAKALRDIGLKNSTDVVGGIRDWQEAGLPTKL